MAKQPPSDNRPPVDDENWRPGLRHADEQLDPDEPNKDPTTPADDQEAGDREGLSSRARARLAEREQAAAIAAGGPKPGEPGQPAYDTRTAAEREAAPIPYTPETAQGDTKSNKKSKMKIWLTVLGILGLVGGGASFYGAVTGLPRDLIEQAAHTTRQRVSGYVRQRVQPYVLSFLSKSIFGNNVAIANCANDKSPVPMITKDCFYRSKGNYPKTIVGRAWQAWWDGRMASRMSAAGIDIQYRPGGGGKPPYWTMSIAGTREFEVSIDDPEGDLERIFSEDALTDEDNPNGRDPRTRGDVFKIQRMFMERFTDVTYASRIERIQMRGYWKRQFGLSACIHFCITSKRALPEQTTLDRFRARLLGNITVKVLGVNTFGLAWACMISREYSCSEADSEFRRQHAAAIDKARAKGVDVATIEKAIQLGDLAKNSGQRLATVLLKDVLTRVIGRTATSILTSPIPVVGQVLAAIGVAGIAIMVYNIYDSLSGEDAKLMATYAKDEAFIGAANVLAVSADEQNAIASQSNATAALAGSPFQFMGSAFDAFKNVALKPLYDSDAISALSERLNGYEKSLVWQSQYGNIAGFKNYQALFGREAQAATLGADEYPNRCNDDGDRRHDNYLVCANWQYDYTPPVIALAQKGGIPPGATNEAIDNIAGVANDILNFINTPADAATEAAANTPVGQQVAQIVGQQMEPVVKEVNEQVLAPPFDDANDVRGAKLLDAAWAGMDRSHNLMVKGGLEADGTPYGWGRLLTDAEVKEQFGQAKQEIAEEFASLPLWDRLMSTKYSQSFASQFAFAAPTAINSPFQFAASILSPMTGMRYAAMNSPTAKAAITPYSNFFHMPYYGLGKTELGAAPALKENDPTPCPNDRTPMNLNNPKAINRGTGQAEIGTANLCAADEYALKVFSGFDSPEPIDELPTNSAISPVSQNKPSGEATGVLRWPIDEDDYKYDTGCFGDDRGYYRHPGVDLVGKKGDGRTLIKAADGGTVAYVNKNSPSAGGMVVIKHANKKYTTYMHMHADLRVAKGDAVQKGDVIGREGNRGMSSGAHLHLELGSAVDGNINTNENPLPHLQPWSGAYRANTSCER